MALTTAQIQNAYVAFFNRPADVAGLNYWMNYNGSIADLSESELEQAFGKMPTVDVSNEDKDVVNWLVDSQIYKSKRQARSSM